MTGELHLEDFQGFTCTSCGLCCTRAWGVGIDAAMEIRIRESATYARLEREGYVPIALGQDGQPGIGGKKANGDCVFLADENRCALHAELGPQGKPVACQLYPYRAVRTPTGVYFSQSWVCPPVVAGVDRNVAENREQLSRLLHDFPEAAAPLPEGEYPVRVTADLCISWASYLNLEKRLLEAYDPDRPVNSLLALVTNLIVAARVQPRTLGTWGALDEIPEDLSLEREILQMYLAGIFSVVESSGDTERRDSLAGALADGQGIPSRLLPVVLPLLSLDLPQGPRLREAYHRYFRNMVAGKSLLLPSLVKGLLAMAVGHVMLGLYAEALRLHRGEDELSLESLTAAFEIVESELFHSGTLAPFFSDFEATFLQLASA